MLINGLTIFFHQTFLFIKHFVFNFLNEQPLSVIIGDGKGALNGPEQLTEIIFGIVE